MELIVATHNAGKFKEIKSILQDSQINVLSLNDIGYKQEIVENGNSYFENALKKAREICNHKKEEFILSDDSGLEVDYLDGKPGIHSARFAGEKSTDTDRINKLLHSLRGVGLEKRGAHFVCVMVLVSPDGCIHSTRGESYGAISLYPQGNEGFGYDPVFLPVEFGYSRSFATIPSSIKNRISHRARALSCMTEIIKDISGNI